MYLNTGYLNHSHMDFKDKSRPLIVGSCGTYRLSRHPKLPTYRPRGRLDYQIIYITAGCGHFHFDNVNNETIVPAGNIVLYRPKELQKYEYYGEDKTEVYWIHFTGSNAKNILRQYGFPDKERVFQVGTSNEYEQIFKRIIIEFQRCQDNYEEMLQAPVRPSPWRMSSPSSTNQLWYLRTIKHWQHSCTVSLRNSSLRTR